MGVQDAVGQGADLRGLPGAGLLLALRDAAEQHRDADGRRLPRPPGPGAHGRLRAGRRAARRRAPAGLDDDAVDAARQPRPRRRPGHRLRRRRARRRALRPRRRPGSTPTTPSSAPAVRSAPCAAPSWSARATGRCSTSSPTHAERASRCSAADFVSTEEGTGIVHMAPGFGEDDQVACNAVGIPTVVPMDEHGRYTAEVAPWAGQHVFDANPLVIRHLKDARRRRAPRDLRPLLPALLAVLRSRSSTGRSRRGSSRSPSSATAWSSSTSRSPGCPTTSRTAASASGWRTPATGRSAATGSGVRRSRCGAATTRRTRASTSTARIAELEADFGVAVTDLHRPARRRARPAQPRRPDRVAR